MSLFQFSKGGDLRIIEESTVIGIESRVSIVELRVQYPEHGSMTVYDIDGKGTHLATCSAPVAKTSSGFSKSVMYSWFNRHDWEVGEYNS